MLLKKLATLWLLAVVLWTCPVHVANAACGDGASTCWWVGGGSSTAWNATGNTNWGTASNTRDNVGPPVAGDHVCFDGSANGNTASNLSTAFSIADIDFTGCGGGGGSYTQSLTFGAVTLTISGNDAGAPGGAAFKLSSGMTYGAAAANRATTFTATSGTSSIISAGKNMGNLTLNGVGGTFQLSTNAYTGTDTNTTITLTNGTFNSNGQNVTVPFFSSSNSNTRVLTMGSSVWTITGSSGTPFDLTTATNLTVNADTSTLSFVAPTAGARSFATGGKAFNIVSASDANSNLFAFTISGAPTIATLNLTAPLNITFSNATTTTITNAFTWTGTSTAPFYVRGSNAPGGTNATISIASGTPTIAWGIIDHMTFSGGATFSATNSLSLSNNSGITITPPSTGGGGFIIGGG